MSDTTAAQSILAAPDNATSNRVSLGKAQKWHERLVSATTVSADESPLGYRPRRRRHIAPNNNTGSAVFTVTVPATARGEDLVISARDRAVKARAEMEEVMALASDAVRVKEAIFAANQASGASAVMASIRLWQQRLDMASKGLEAIAQASDALSLEAITRDHNDLADRLEQASHGALAGGGGAVYLQVQWQTREEIMTARQEARRALNILDDELRHLNATYMVDLTVSPAGAMVLGL